MKEIDGWTWPDSERHMVEWMAAPANRMIMNGRPAYQGKKQAYALTLCERRRVAIDIGAHIGTWAYNLACAFDLVRCFEPVADHRACLGINVTQPNVIIYPLALGDTRGYVRMETGPQSTGDTSVDARAGMAASAACDLDVRMETLDSFDFEAVDFIKIDAEGFEERILMGAADTLERCKPVLCVEQKRDWPRKYGLQPQGAVRFLEARGYVQAREIGGDYFMVPKP